MIDANVTITVTTTVTANPAIVFGIFTIDNLIDLGIAGGTIGAVIVALYSQFWQPKSKLTIEYQKELEGGLESYWHEIFVQIDNPQDPNFDHTSYSFLQARIWVNNTGRVEAKGCQVKLRIIDATLQGRDPPVEFLLPVFQFYRPHVVLLSHTGKPRLSAPQANELEITIPPHNREAFELVFYQRQDNFCATYSKTDFPSLDYNKRYRFELTAYAEKFTPKKPYILHFFWDGMTSRHLSEALYAPS